MNEQLENALTELINKSVSGLDATKDFLSAEIPEVITQLLMWHGVHSFGLFIIAVLIPLGFLIFNLKYWKWMIPKGKEANWDGEWIPAISFPMLAHVIFFMIFIECVNVQWLQIWIAPKVWLLEYAADIVK